MNQSHTIRAFSLVELSIVLVILGLLVGGILAGQSLIRASELRAASSEYQRYATAGHTFRDKYFAIPGDITNATQVWGRMNGNADCVTNSGASTVSTGSCDGDGNGQIAQAGAGSQSGESFQFWRQLALAGLIEGTYTGLAGAGGVGHAVIGTNVPTSRLSTAGWATRYHASGSADFYSMTYGNVLQIGANSATGTPYTAIMKPEEAWNIDTKLDDGRPGYGKIIAIHWNNLCSDASSNTDYDSDYRLTDTAIRCALVFKNVY